MYSLFYFFEFCEIQKKTRNQKNEPKKRARHSLVVGVVFSFFRRYSLVMFSPDFSIHRLLLSAGKRSNKT